MEHDFRCIPHCISPWRMDDWHGATARVKFFWQILASFVVLWNQPKFGLTQTFGFDHSMATHLDLAIGIFWTTYVCNAFNLIDGLDGLAGGTAFLLVWACSLSQYHCTTTPLLSSFSYLQEQCWDFISSTDSCKNFMGDSGSLFIDSASLCSR